MIGGLSLKTIFGEVRLPFLGCDEKRSRASLTPADGELWLISFFL